MRKRKFLIYLALMLIPAISALAQEPGAGYNPFVPANLDDPNKLEEVPVVESSIHTYRISGDQNYDEPSTFVWYVENGTFGTYDAVTDTWTPTPGTTSISNGVYLELPGSALNGSEIVVRWNDGTGNTTGYIAVYERSADNCVFNDQISGRKHQILVPPEVWFLVDEREECSDQIYSVTAQFNETHTNSFPYLLRYTYPGQYGIPVQADTLVYDFDLDDSNRLNWDLEAVQDLDVSVDEIYTITLDELRDNYGSIGKIAPLGSSQNQHSEITITIFHLPQTNTMTMD